jgi:hypothetical protein
MVLNVHMYKVKVDGHVINLYLKMTNPSKIILALFACASLVDGSVTSEEKAPTEAFLNVRERLSAPTIEDSAAIRATSGITGARNCSILLEQNGELLSLLLEQKRISLFTDLFERCQKTNTGFMKVFIDVSVRSTSHEALEFMYDQVNKTSSAAQFRQYIFGECGDRQNYSCFRLFGASVCSITTSTGQNILHMAAAKNDFQFFEIADRCKLLISQKNFDGFYPSEYARTGEMAVALANKWRKVAREMHMSLESVTAYHGLCQKFELSPTTEEIVKPGSTLKAAFAEGINDARNVYCPQLMTLVNLIEMEKETHELKVNLQEWLSTLLSDIFTQHKEPGDGTVASLEEFTAPLFEYSQTLEGYVPTGLYNEAVYEFVGKVLSITHYFGFGFNYPIKISDDTETNPQVRKSFEAFQRGLNALHFAVKVEIHPDELSREHFILKTETEMITVIIVNPLSFDSMARDGYMLMRAFESLTDAQKTQFINLLRGNAGRNRIRVRIKGLESNGKRFELSRTELAVEYSKTVQGFAENLEMALSQSSLKK